MVSNGLDRRFLLCQGLRSAGARKMSRRQRGAENRVFGDQPSRPRRDYVPERSSTTLEAARPSVTMAVKWRAHRSKANRFSSR